MMRRALAVLFILLSVWACGHKIEEKDLLGTWKVDPSAVMAKDAAAASKVTVDFTGDHRFVMAVNAQFSVKGSWAYQDKKFTMTPTTMAVQSPFDPAKTMDVPLAEAIQTLQKMGTNPEAVDAMQKLSGTTTYEVSDDGKKMSENGKPALLKASENGG